MGICILRDGFVGFRGGWGVGSEEGRIPGYESGGWMVMTII